MDADRRVLIEICNLASPEEQEAALGDYVLMCHVKHGMQMCCRVVDAMVGDGWRWLVSTMNPAGRDRSFSAHGL